MLWDAEERPLSSNVFLQVIEDASRGSKFYAKKQADQAKVSQQVKELKASLASFTSLELSSARADADLLIGKLRAGRILNKVSKILSQEVTDCFKVIVHVDMDMFYAAVEMRDQPELVDKPMAVGGMGMLSTSNYKVLQKSRNDFELANLSRLGGSV